MTTLDNVMQAAERLRRLVAEEDAGTADCGTIDDIYGGLELDQFDDCHTLADYLLSILPQGERPVAMTKPEKWDEVQTGWACNEFRDYSTVEQRWRQGGCYYRDAACKTGGSRSGGPLYATEAEAWLELEWRYFEQWQQKAQAARQGAAGAR